MCRTLPIKNQKDKSIIIVRFANRKYKTELLRQGKKLRGSNVYINEHLTKVNADIARKARYLRKKGKILSTWSANGKVFIKTNGSPEHSRILYIRDVTQLDKMDN